MRTIKILLIGAVLLGVFLTACTTQKQSKQVSQEVLAFVGEIPESFFVESENYLDYQPGSECSAFASAYILRHFGEEADGMTLYKNFPGKLPESGVLPYGISKFFRNKGYIADFICNGTVNDLKRELNKGVPVIVFIHVEEPYTDPHNTHYVPLVGYDEDYLYFAESLDYLANCKDETGLSYNRRTEISEFERLWKGIDETWDYPYFQITTSKSLK